MSEIYSRNREIGSEFDIVHTPDAYFKELMASCTDSLILRSGREALGLIAENLQNTCKTALLPSYICSSMVKPFENRGWKIYYYNLTENLHVEESSVLPLIDEKQPTVFLIMSYFQAWNYRDLLEKVKQHSPQTKTIIDFTHCFLDFHAIQTEQADYYVASLRKWFGITGGAVLFSNERVDKSFIEIKDETGYCALKEKALSLKYSYLSNPDDKVKACFKEIIRNADELLTYDHIYYASKADVLRLQEMNMGLVKERRINNLRTIWDRVKDNPSINCLIDIETVSLAPNFMLPLMVSNRPEVQKKLSSSGIYAQVVWRVPDEATCKNSIYVYKHILCIPIDQRYNVWDMEYIADIINQINII